VIILMLAACSGGAKLPALAGTVTAESGQSGEVRGPVAFGVTTAGKAAVLVALGRFASETRLVPFEETLQRALDKVRSALSTSAQRELIGRLDELSFVGVPTRPSSKAVRAALERAWFEQQPLRIRYRDADGVPTTREIRIESVVMERTETRINAFDSAKGQSRQFRLDRIEKAEMIGPT
jgi:predicted DNA-binding transcriptional regulator YafY